MRGRSDCRLASLTAHAGLKKRLVGQEPSQPGKPITPCLIEKKACGAGAIPGQQASHILPESKEYTIGVECRTIGRAAFFELYSQND